MPDRAFFLFPEEPAESYPLDKFLDFLNVRQDSDVSASEMEMGSSFAPSSRMRETEMVLPSTGGSQSIQITSVTLLPAVGTLVHALPEIIQNVAMACDLMVPIQQHHCPPTSWYEDLLPSSPATGSGLISRQFHHF